MLSTGRVATLQGLPYTILNFHNALYANYESMATVCLQRCDRPTSRSFAT